MRLRHHGRAWSQITYGFGVGWLRAPLMGRDTMSVPEGPSDHSGVAVVVIATWSIWARRRAWLGIIEGLTKVFFPEASNTVIFIIMALVLLVRPAGLFGRTA